MSVRKRTWTTRGVTRTRWVYDRVDPVTGKRTQPVVRDHLGKPVTTRAAAERIAAAQYVADASTEPGTAATPTVSILLALHSKRRDISQATQRMERYQSGHLVRLLPDIPVNQITTAMLEDYATMRQSEATGEKRTTTVSGATVKKEIALLAHAIRWARDRDIITVDPPRLPKIVTQSRLARALTHDELQRLLTACGGDDSPLRQTVEFAYLTGLRRAELYRLTWDDVDFDSKRLVFTTVKRGKSTVQPKSVVYLPDRALDLLKRRKTPENDFPWVFGVPTYTLDGVETNVDPAIVTKLRSAARRAKLKNPRQIGLHTLRHTCATHMIKAGATIPEVAAHLRHRDGGALLLRIYAHVFEDGLRRAGALLTQQNCNKSTT